VTVVNQTWAPERSTRLFRLPSLTNSLCKLTLLTLRCFPLPLSEIPRRRHCDADSQNHCALAREEASNPRVTGLRDSIQLSGGQDAGEGRTLTGRAALFDLLAILTTSLVVVACLLYAQVTGTYDATTFMVSVVLPLVLGSAILLTRKERILLFAFLAYFWAVVDDAPVFFDSVITWPEVTRFHPFLPRLFMNIVIHALTALFLYLSVRESMKGKGVGLRNAPRVIVLASVAFVLAYAQNIPLPAIQNVVETSWYPFDFAEKVVSILFLYLALWEAMKLKASSTSLSTDSGPSSSFKGKS